MTSDETRAEFVSSGPIYPGESLHDAMGRNTIAHVVRDARRMPTPGHGFEDAAEDANERASQHTVQNVYDHAATAGVIHSALRPGA